jgi:MFS superfamily sulfate permease-like transporter
VWGLLVPEMIAYSGLAGLPPQAGVYTLLATLAACAIFGTNVVSSREGISSMGPARAR